MTSCGYCYQPSSNFKCAACKKRSYCSRECQTADWKCGHKHWCGVAGELGADFDIRDTGIPGKGLGIFALRDFQRSEKIMAERYVMSNEGAGTIPEGSEPIAAAVMALDPAGASMTAKFLLNCISCEDEGGLSGLFLHMSRVNHDCIGNSAHFYVEKHQVKILVAARAIQAGEEITFSYVCGGTSKAFLSKKWGFTCSCPACLNPALGGLVEEMHELDADIPRLGRRGEEDMAIRKARRLLSVYDQLGASSCMSYARTYYDLFSMNVTRQRTMDEAKRFIKLAHQAECETYSGCKDRTCGWMLKFQGYVGNPALHPNYRALG